MKLLFFIFCFWGGYQSLIAQEKQIIYEQVAFNFFLDSLMTTDNSNVKLIYYSPTVNNEHSYLKSPIGFTDYKNNKIDSLDFVAIEKEQDSIKRIDLSKYVLMSGKWKNQIKSPIPKKTKKSTIKKSIQIEVFKRYIYRINRYIVEIKVWGYKTRIHYFIEVDKNEITINRWYKVFYVY